VLVVLRILGLALAVALATTVLAWMFTRDRKWLRLAWQIFKYGVYALAFVLLMFAGEALFHAG
jgi:fructose-specific phosphotransferase system IIC component